MKNYKQLILIAIALFLSTLACNLQRAMDSAGTTEVRPAIQETRPVQDVPDAVPSQPTMPPPPTEPPPEDTPTPTNTPTVTPTDTPSIPIVTVTENTNCRSGPGTVYDLVYIFMVGDEAEIIGRSSVSNYVIIKVPDSSGRTCWLWTQYAVIKGNTNALPESTPPPTPTPAATATPAFNFNFSFDSIDLCGPNEVVFIGVTNTGDLDIESHHTTGQNLDSLEVRTSQADVFAAGAGCFPWPMTTIHPGEKYYVYLGFTPPIFGDTISVTIKACAEDGLGAPCLTKTKTINLPSPSDMNAKENFAPVDTTEILDLVSELPITTWSYTDRDPESRHIGPMAQEFNPLFDVGEYEDHISAIDSSGVALAAIQELDRIAEGQAAQIAQLKRQNEALYAQNEALNSRLQTLETTKETQPLPVLAYLLPTLALICVGILAVVKKKPDGKPGSG
jgi:uncharacterized protein YgiM (DUF1202 family)